MTIKPIEYDPHAARRMRQRGFTRQDVKDLLFGGEWSPEVSRPDSLPRYSRTGLVRGQRARVIYLEDGTRYYIVTVEWLYA